MKKTPLAKLIEFMGQNQYFIGNDLYAKQKELLEEERQNLIDAHEDSTFDKMSADQRKLNHTGEQYFNENYEQ